MNDLKAPERVDDCVIAALTVEDPEIELADRRRQQELDTAVTIYQLDTGMHDGLKARHN